MLLAIISDTHLPRGPRRLPDACVERLEAADLILHAGDFSAVAVLQALETLAPSRGCAETSTTASRDTRWAWRRLGAAGSSSS